MIRTVRSFLFVPFLAAIVVLGCKTSSTPSSVSGKVTYNGKRVTGGIISFIPVDGNDRYFTDIKEDGTYLLKEAPKGDMVVVVETESINPDPPGRPKMELAGSKDSISSPKQQNEMMRKMGRVPADAGTPEGKYVQIPLTYNEKSTSKLKTTLKSGKNEYDAVLTD